MKTLATSPFPYPLTSPSRGWLNGSVCCDLLVLSPWVREGGQEFPRLRPSVGPRTSAGLPLPRRCQTPRC